MHLRAVQVLDEEVAWAVGDEGMMMHSTSYGLTSWRRKAFGVTSNNLRGVFFESRRRGWAVGEFGTVLYTADSGETWTFLPVRHRRKA